MCCQTCSCSGTKQERNNVIEYFSDKLFGKVTSPSDTFWDLGIFCDSDFLFHEYTSQVHFTIIFIFQLNPASFASVAKTISRSSN